MRVDYDRLVSIVLNRTVVDRNSCFNNLYSILSVGSVRLLIIDLLIKLQYYFLSVS